MQVDSLPQAYKYFGLAIKMNPKFAKAYYGKGRCAEEFKHYDEARALYHDCLSITPKDELAREGMKRLQSVQ